MDNLFEELQLGSILSKEEITGGLTNKLYKVITNTGIFAVKEIDNNNLNGLSKIEQSENIANIAKENGVNAVSALSFNNHYIQCYNEKNYLIYNWCKGIVLKTSEISLGHVKILAQQLAYLHRIKVNKNINNFIYEKINYRKYYELLKDNNEEWAKPFKDNINILCSLYDTVYSNYLELSNQLSYIHRDFNRKNILWHDNTPNVIDWETATIGNPSIDFFNSAWFLTADVDIDKYNVFAKEYFKLFKLEDDINVAVYASIIEECNWLEFSLKRATDINSSEKELGKQCISSSLNEIMNYYNKIPLMIDVINKIKLELQTNV